VFLFKCVDQIVEGIASLEIKIVHELLDVLNFGRLIFRSAHTLTPVRIVPRLRSRSQVDRCRRAALSTRPRIVFLLGITVCRRAQQIRAWFQIAKRKLATCIRSCRCDLHGLNRSPIRSDNHHPGASRDNSAGNPANDATRHLSPCRLRRWRSCKDKCMKRPGPAVEKSVPPGESAQPSFQLYSGVPTELLARDTQPG